MRDGAGEWPRSRRLQCRLAGGGPVPARGREQARRPRWPRVRARRRDRLGDRRQPRSRAALRARRRRRETAGTRNRTRAAAGDRGRHALREPSSRSTSRASMPFVGIAVATGGGTGSRRSPKTLKSEENAGGVRRVHVERRDRNCDRRRSWLTPPLAASELGSRARACVGRFRGCASSLKRNENFFSSSAWSYLLQR